MRIEQFDSDGRVRVVDGKERALVTTTAAGAIAFNGDVTTSGSITPGGRIVEPLCVDQYLDVTVSAAEMLALYTTPKTLVAAPAAGYFLWFQGAILFLDYNSAAYGGIAAGEDLKISYTDGSGTALAQLETTGFLDATADALRVMLPYRPASGLGGLTPTVAAAIVLSLLVGNITTGDSPLKVRTFYRVLPASL